jgi:hypothetical protein
MRLGTTVLPKARIVSDTPVKKTVHHPYAWSNLNRTTEMGMGAREIVIEGYTSTAAERDMVEAACQATGSKTLYFESSLTVMVEDRYYTVKTSAAAFTCENASVWYYAFTAWADDPAAYYTATDTVVLVV